MGWRIVYCSSCSSIPTFDYTRSMEQGECKVLEIGFYERNGLTFKRKGDVGIRIQWWLICIPSFR